MKFPYFKQWDNATCVVYIQSTEPTENGEFSLEKTYKGGCNLSEKARSVRSADGQYHRLTSVIHIKGDIAPDMPEFTGSVTVNGKTKKIETVDRPRNPDGTIHHTRLGLI